MMKTIGKIDRDTQKHIESVSDRIGEQINSSISRNASINKIPVLQDEINNLKEDFEQSFENVEDRLKKIKDELNDIKANVENIYSVVNQEDSNLVNKIKELQDHIQALENRLIDDMINKQLSLAKGIIDQIGNNWINE